MTRFFEHQIDSLFDFRRIRRFCIGLLMGGFCLLLALPGFAEEASPEGVEGSILQAFLEEELTYQIGFWLFPRCGQAKVRFGKTDHPGVYRASVEGRTVGIMNALLGKYSYSYISDCELSPEGDRLRPLRFQLIKRRLSMVSQRTVVFDHAGREITLSQTLPDGKYQEEKIPMEDGMIYEDYLTLFYNFRYGWYGPLQRGRVYHLPLHIHRGLNFVDLSIASREEEERLRRRESKNEGKHFFLRFRVRGEDISSASGEIEGWLSHDRIPTKGTIKDVILFGDLWAILI